MSDVGACKSASKDANTFAIRGDNHDEMKDFHLAGDEKENAFDLNVLCMSSPAV